MKTTNKNNFKEFVEGVHMKYKPILGLQLWEHTIEICDEDNTADDTTIADIGQMQSYLRYKITFYKIAKRLFEDDKEKLERIIIHELCHVLTEPLYVIARTHCPPAEDCHVEKERERLTEILSKFVYAKTK